MLNAAYPHALSSTEATAPACRNPCCWVNRSSCRSDISTLPGSAGVTSTPSVLIILWRLMPSPGRSRGAAPPSAGTDGWPAATVPTSGRPSGRAARRPAAARPRSSAARPDTAGLCRTSSSSSRPRVLACLAGHQDDERGTPRMDRRQERRGRFRGNALCQRADRPRLRFSHTCPRRYQAPIGSCTTTMSCERYGVQLVFARWCLWLAGDAAPQAGRALGIDRRLRAPLGDLDHAGVEQLQAVEEARDDLAGARHVVALGQVLVHPPHHLGHRLG